ncbi:hypothetical protein E1B28_001794 [Marasmius oreades]|uniref:CBM1 domain-containing protein n=1 Tax=Marasmius oreades TaxID=181124 RepID=A0A9P7V4C1_9AGAR|nr:uncharacterized protein E1B28_001794 [Marasmius oreades]KAG7100007.1 hypothetical protein E1B28_001794 [Marasmius oreades]
MKMSLSLLMVFGLGVVPTVIAQAQPVWGQCGGIGWVGSTACTSGTTCTTLNAYFSQCIPSGTGPTSSTTSSGSTPTSPTASANFWFSFGDSYTATAFNPSGKPPQVGNPMGNPTYPGGTVDGGPNWIDYMTVERNNSLVLTWNYAYGGATIDATLAPPYSPTVLSLTDQINQFLNGTAKKPTGAPWTSQNSLVSFWIGINDLSWSWWQQEDRLAYNDKLLDAYFALVMKTYNVGARNFLFNTVPPFERSPYFIGIDTNHQGAPILNGVIVDYNSKLKTRVRNLSTNLTGVKTWIWDSNSTFTPILNDPKAYGFRDATTYGAGTDLFWGNDNQGLHPSSTAHKFLAQDVANVLAGTVW